MLLAALTYALFSFYVPYIGDDYALVADYMTANGGSGDLTAAGFLKFVSCFREIDNGRLDNFIFVVMRLACAKWLLAAVVGLSASVMIWAAARLVSPVRRVLPFVIMAVWGWIAFTFPWRGDGMGVDNSFNMLLPSAVSLLFLLLVRKAGRNAIGSAAALTGGCVFAFCAGWIHEGYSMPVCCGLGLLALLRRFRLSWQFWAVALCYLAGTLYAVSAPGLWLRLSAVHTDGPAAVNLKTQLSLMISTATALAVTLVIGLGILARHGWRIVAAWFSAEPLRITVAGIFFASVVVAFSTAFCNARVWWICSLFGTVFMFQVIAPVFQNLSRRVLVCAAALAFALIAAFYANVIRVQKSISDEETSIRQAMAESDYGTVYRDYDIAIPKTTLLHPVNAHWRNVLHITGYNIVMADGRLFSVVPECLSGLTDGMADFIEGKSGASAPPSDDPEKWPQPLPGSAGLFAFGNALLKADEVLVERLWTGDDAERDCMYETYDYLCSDGRRFDRMPSIVIRFLSPSGRRLLYVAPAHAKVTGPYVSVSGHRE